jgi:3-oxoacyl-[acyl-carrier protein] reductase
MDWSDQTVLVVSGTSRVGRAVVESVADCGGTVGFTYHTARDEAEELLDGLSGSGHRSWRCDVTDEAATAETVSDAFESFDGVDALVYTVGVIRFESVSEASERTLHTHLDLNVKGAFTLLGAAAPHLEAQGHGAVVALSASAGILRKPNLASYDASKRALEGLIEEAARELGPAGVRANVVAPGFVRDPESLSDPERRDVLADQPVERLTTARDVADACLFLCSDWASRITGAVLPVDGGAALT